MKKINLFTFFIGCFLPILSLGQDNNTLSGNQSPIDTSILRQHIQILSSDSLGGRETGTDGAFFAAQYIAGCFQKAGLQAPEYNSFLLPFSTPKIYGINVVGIMEGSDLREQAVVVSAHYDHVGTYDGHIYNGADDNASGVAAMLEIARAFSEKGIRPRRTIIFIAFDAKEKELQGSAAYAAEPVFPLNHTMVDLNIDAIGRIEGSPNGIANYMFLVGADRLSSDLRTISDEINHSHHIDLYLDYSFYDSETFSEIFYMFSDQYNFGKHDIPIIYYTGGLHDDLYKPSDQEEFINYGVLKKRTDLIFYTAWELANRSERLKKDIKKR